MEKINIEELLERVKFLEQRNKELERSKKYGLVWEDTKEELDLKPVIPMLKKEESMNVGNIEEEPRNYLIEGDNYHALKALQHTHKNKVDVIYIDPPYNTGNEFVYNDKIVDKEDNFRHSKWLSFMDKRLRLAKNLMSDDGVIFVSIDDNEQAQLKLLMDEIFGEGNHVGTLVWENKEGGGGSDSKFFRIKHEYIHMYVKNREQFIETYPKGIRKLPITDSERYRYKDKHFKVRGKYQLQKLDVGSLGYVSSLDYPIQSPNGELIYPNKNKLEKVKRWRWSKEKVQWGIENDFIVFKEDRDGNLAVYTKQYMNVDNEENIIERGHSPLGIISEYSTTQSAKFIRDIFNGKKVFDYTKPSNLIKYLLNRIEKDSAIVLDFFAGSGTTGHAVLELNKEDGGNRSFILCTNNEVSEEKVRQHFVDKGLLDKNNKTAFNKFKEENLELVEEFYQSEEYQQLGIARSVTRERIKRVSEGYTTPKGVKVEGLGGNLEYFVTEEFSEEDVYGFKRNQLAELALNSHSIKYPTNNFQNILVGTFTNLDEIELDKTKKPTFLINARDNETLSKRMEEITKKYGNDTVIHSIEDYYDEF